MDTFSFKSISSSVKNWWALLLLGVVYVVLGIWTVITPFAAYLSLSLLFSISILFTGFIEISFSISNRKILDGWGWYFAGGLFNIIVGILVIRQPALTAIIFASFIGFLMMFTGIRAIGTALDIRNYKGSNWGWLLMFGILTIIFSFFIVGNIVFGTITIVVTTALALLSAGAFYIALSLRLKKLHM